MACGNFLKRPFSYKIGVGCLVFGAVLYLVGFTTPYWKEQNDGSVYSGLWSECKRWTDTCSSTTAEETPVWWPVMQVLESMGLFAVILSCACTIFENSCWSDVSAPRLMQEFTAFFGGILCAIGWIILLAETESDNTTTFSWAFYLTIIASVFIIIAAFVILFGGKMVSSSKDLPALTSGYVGKGHVSPAPARRLSHLWADSRPQTPELVGKYSGRAPQPPSQLSCKLPPLPPIGADTNGASVDSRVYTSPSPSFSEPRMSIISMSAEQHDNQ